MGRKIDVKRAAEESGMSVSWWRQRIFRKEIPFYKVSRRILIDTDDLNAILERCRQEPSASK